MIHPSGTFDYVGRVRDFEPPISELTFAGRAAQERDMLVGLSPTIVFSGTHVSLSGSNEETAKIFLISYPIGDAPLLAIKPDDTVYLVRDLEAHFGFSILRGDQLVLALGAVSIVPLGGDLRVVRGPSRNPWEEIGETWIECIYQGAQCRLCNRNSVELGDYQIYLESKWRPGADSIQEHAGICLLGDPQVQLATIRSTVLLANCSMTIVDWHADYPRNG